MLFKEAADNDLSPTLRQSRFSALLATPGGPFIDAKLPMIDSVRKLAQHVTATELRKRQLPSFRIHPEDVAHEALLVFIERCHLIREPARLRSWFWSVMRKKVVKLLGRNLPVVEVSELDLIDLEPAESIAQLFTGSDSTTSPRISAVRAAVSGLSPRLRKVVVLHIIRGLSHEEIARLLGIKPSAVRVRWLRAKRELATKLAAVLPKSA